MKAMDIKLAFKACGGGVKRKRDDVPSTENDDTKISKISKTEDLNKDSSQNVCNGNLSTSGQTDVIISSGAESCILGDPKSSSVNNNESFDKSKSEDDVDDSGLNKTLGENDTTVEDCGSSVSEEDELDSSVANQSLDMSTSSNVGVDGQSDMFMQDVEENSGCQNSQVENSTALDKMAENTDQSKPKKKKRMTTEEAKLKTELRAQKERERELRRQEILAKKEERRLLKEKKEQERKMALEEKQKKKELEEQLKKEKKLQEEMLKEEKNRLKQLALEAKAEEKRRKEEQKQKALEEKLKAVEEKRKAEEEKKKAEEERMRLEQEKERKTKEAFVNFFVRSGFSISQSPPQRKEVVFRPFQVTEGMVLAPAVPPEAQQRFNKDELDHHLSAQDCQDLYLSKLKSGLYKSLRSKKKPAKENLCDSEVIVISDTDAPELKLKAKLLQFCENVRPAYWGTWRKKSKNIHARNPFAKDEILDYDVDSDDEWDEGGPGESLTGTEEEESEDDYEVDNEFFVPHGYLSAEEEGEDEDDNRASADPEEFKMRLKMKEKEFLHERKKKTTELKPVILGCFFDADGTEDIIAVEKSLMPYSAELLTQTDILTAKTVTSSQNNDGPGLSNVENSPTSSSKVLNFKRPVPEEGMPFLIKLLHANTNSRLSVIKEFQAFWHDHCNKDFDSEPNSGMSSSKVYKISKRQLDVTIQNISSWMKSPDPNFKKYCWWVREEIRKKYNCMDVPVPNQWDYVSSKEINSTQASTPAPAMKTVVMNED